MKQQHFVERHKYVSTGQETLLPVFLARLIIRSSDRYSVHNFKTGNWRNCPKIDFRLSRFRYPTYSGCTYSAMWCNASKISSPLSKHNNISSVFIYCYTRTGINMFVTFDTALCIKLLLSFHFPVFRHPTITPNGFVYETDGKNKRVNWRFAFASANNRTHMVLNCRIESLTNNIGVIHRFASRYHMQMIPTTFFCCWMCVKRLRHVDDILLRKNCFFFSCGCGYHFVMLFWDCQRGSTSWLLLEMLLSLIRSEFLVFVKKLVLVFEISHIGH